jgi:hypothetical protein
VLLTTLPSPGGPIVDIDDHSGFGCHDLEDHFLAHVHLIRLGFDQVVHVDIARSGVARGKEINLRLGAENGNRVCRCGRCAHDFRRGNGFGEGIGGINFLGRGWGIELEQEGALIPEREGAGGDENQKRNPPHACWEPALLQKAVYGCDSKPCQD